MSEGASKDNKSEAPYIKRRKITLTQQHDELLRELANEHYGGNCSQCIRSALKDHERTIDGVSEMLLHRIADNIEQLDTSVKQLHRDHSGNSSRTAHKMNRSEDRRPTISETSDQNELENQRAHTVYDQLAASQSGPLSIEQLVSNGLPERAVRHALVDLEIKGYVESDTIEGTRVYSTISGEDNSE